MKTTSLALAAFTVLFSMFVGRSAADEMQQTVVDSYFVKFHCEAVRDELNAAVQNSTETETVSHDSLSDVAASSEDHKKSISGLSDRLNTLCGDMLKTVTHGNPTESEVTSFLSSLDGVAKKARALASGSQPSATTDFVDLQPSHPDNTWNNSPETASTMLKAYFKKTLSSSQSGETPGAIQVQQTFKYYVTLLIVDSTTSSADDESLRVAFTHLGKFIGNARAAIWLGQYADPKKPDVDHARLWMLALQKATKYPLKASGGPYVIFSEQLPDEATDVYVVDLHPYSIDDKVKRIDELADDLDASKPDNARLDPTHAYWQDVELRVSEVLTSVFGGFFKHG